MSGRRRQLAAKLHLALLARGPGGVLVRDLPFAGDTAQSERDAIGERTQRRAVRGLRRVGEDRMGEREIARRVYVNFLDADDDALAERAAYGDRTYRRLAEVKAKYDPDNAFHHNKNIQPG